MTAARVASSAGDGLNCTPPKIVEQSLRESLPQPPFMNGPSKFTNRTVGLLSAPWASGSAHRGPC